MADGAWVERELHVRIRYKKGPFAEDIPHLANHLTKVAGHLARIADWSDHEEPIDGLVREFQELRGPDLLIVLQMLADHPRLKFDLGKATQKRWDARVR